VACCIRIAARVSVSVRAPGGNRARAPPSISSIFSPMIVNLSLAPDLSLIHHTTEDGATPRTGGGPQRHRTERRTPGAIRSSGREN